MDANITIPEKSQRPGGGPSATAPVSRKQAVEFFEQIVANLYEKDYGDFMRKCVLYIERLRTDIGSASPQVAQMIGRMKMYTAYAPDFDIETTRLHLMKDADELRRLV